MSYYVYRYTDLSDGIIKYVGITNNLDKRVAQHSIDDSFKDVLWKIEYFDAENKSTAEAMESHLISVYGTGKYINKAKTNWGVITAFKAVTVSWKTYVKTEKIEDVKSKGRQKLVKSIGTSDCSLIRYTICFDVREVDFEKGYKAFDDVLIKTVRVLHESPHKLSGPLFCYSKESFINRCRSIGIPVEEAIKRIPNLRLYFWNPDKKYSNTSSHITLFDEEVDESGGEIIFRLNKFAIYDVLDKKYFHERTSNLLSHIVCTLPIDFKEFFYQDIEKFSEELELSAEFLANRIIEIDYPKKADPIFSITQLRLNPNRKIIFELKGDEKKSSI